MPPTTDFVEKGDGQRENSHYIPRMASILASMASVFGLGIVYFLAAIPAGVAMGLSPVLAAVAAWSGYVAIGAAMLLVGAPARAWIARRFGLSLEPNPEKVFWRVWQRWGLPGLALLAPVTCGPYFAALIALALGERPARLITWIAVGVIPWCIFFAILAAAGLSLWK
jgi:hypothetical protein